MAARAKIVRIIPDSFPSDISENRSHLFAASLTRSVLRCFKDKQ